MQVINIEPWAGHDFSFGGGVIIELPDDVALARIEAGLAAPIPSSKKGKAPAKIDEPKIEAYPNAKPAEAPKAD